MELKTQSVLVRNLRTDVNKPNEDRLICDAENGIFIVADGVTRPHGEYVPGRDSLAAQAAELLCERVHRGLAEGLGSGQEIPALMRRVLLEANGALSRRFSGLDTSCPPAATLVVCLIRDRSLYFFSTCDAVAVLLRQGAKIQLTDRYNARLKLAGGPDKQTLCREIYNNSRHPDGYGMFNGAPGLADFLFCSQLELADGDRLILSSDGLLQYLLCTHAPALIRADCGSMLRASAAYDRPPFSGYADDKACILVDIRQEGGSLCDQSR